MAKKIFVRTKVSKLDTWFLTFDIHNTKMSTDLTKAAVNLLSSADCETDSEYALKWLPPSYMKAVTGAFGGLRDNGLLCDVTLSCQGQQIQAHRILLAACSPYFKALFRDNPSSHPIIVFRDFLFDDVVAVIHFIYHGEVKVPKNSLASFLMTAEHLQIQGLADLSEDNENQTTEKHLEPQSNHKRRKIDEDILNKVSKNHHNLEIINTQIIPNIINNNTSPIHNGDINEKSINTQPDNLIDLTLNNINQDSNLSDNGTQEDDKFRCTLCWKGFKHPTSLSLHKDSHTGKTQCPVCLRSFSRSYDMRSHFMKIHQVQSPKHIPTKSKTIQEHFT